jgi:hypothetical protein
MLPSRNNYHQCITLHFNQGNKNFLCSLGPFGPAYRTILWDESNLSWLINMANSTRFCQTVLPFLLDCLLDTDSTNMQLNEWSSSHLPRSHITKRCMQTTRTNSLFILTLSLSSLREQLQQCPYYTLHIWLGTQIHPKDPIHVGSADGPHRTAGVVSPRALIGKDGGELWR